MRSSYPLNTEVLLLDKIPARITAVTFYDDCEKYLLTRIKDGDIIEEWFPASHFSVGEIQKIGFQV